jgi:peptide subunit release factor 1 (eRF1)
MITRETVERITGFEPNGLPVTSVYITVPVDFADRGALRGRATSTLQKVRPHAQDQALDHGARMSLRQDFERIESAIGAENWRPGAVAFFACSGSGLFEEVSLPRPVRHRAIVDATPWIGPMMAVLDEFHRYCVAVVDRRTARIWELYAGELLEAREIHGRVLRKDDYGGFRGHEERGVRSRAEELGKRHFREVVEQLEDAFRASGYELLLLGGHQQELPRLVDELPRELAERLAGTFAIDPNTATPASVRPLADEAVERYEREAERRKVSEALERAATGRDAVVGLEDCLWAGSVAGVRELLVEDGAVVPGVVCDADGWLGSSAGRCPVCGGPVRETPDVIDELIEKVVDDGGSVEHVVADTPLREDIVAAFLRFPLPPRVQP